MCNQILGLKALNLKLDKRTQKISKGEEPDTTVAGGVLQR